jgi:hypothetical protein
MGMAGRHPSSQQSATGRRTMVWCSCRRLGDYNSSVWWVPPVCEGPCDGHEPVQGDPQEVIGGDGQADLLHARHHLQDGLLDPSLAPHLAEDRPEVPDVVSLPREQHEGDDQPDEHVGAGEGDYELVEALPAKALRLHKDGDEETVCQEDQHGGGQLNDRAWLEEHLGEVEGFAC